MVKTQILVLFNFFSYSKPDINFDHYTLTAGVIDETNKEGESEG